MIKSYSKADAIKHLEKCGLYIMKPNNMDRFISCGVDAFNGYTIYNYFYQGSKDYHKKLNLAIELLVKAGGEDSLMYADSEEVNGFAQWFPPGFTGIPLWSYIRNGLLKYFLMSDSFSTIYRMDYIEGFSFKKKTEFTQNKDIFLYNLAVKKSMQKKGISSKLVRPMLEYATSINTPCYLETYELVNTKIYENLGFKLLPSTKIPNTSEVHYPMIFKT